MTALLPSRLSPLQLLTAAKPAVGRPAAAGRAWVVVLALLLAGAAGMSAHAAVPFSGTVWAVLSGKQQDEVLQKLHDELEAVRAPLAAERQAEETRNKTLKELIAELDQQDSAFRRYSTKYALLALRGMRTDAKGFAELAGELSAGNYDPLLKAAPEWGAKLFAELIGDALDAHAYEQTHFVWVKLVERGGSLKEAGQAFMRGDFDAVLDAVKKQLRSEGEQIGKAAVVRMINWVLTDTGLQPGQAFLTALELEAQLIEYAHRHINRYLSEDCLVIYQQEYERRSAAGSSHSVAVNGAYDSESFQNCIVVRAVGFRELEAFIAGAGMSARTIYTAMLEDWRNDGTRPRAWLAERIAERRASAESEAKGALANSKQRLDRAGRQFYAALRQRLNALANEMLSEEKRKRLEKEARAALAEVERDLQRLAAASTGAAEACATYDAGRNAADAALGRAENASAEAYDISLEARTIPQCTIAESEMSRLAGTLAEARQQSRRFVEAVEAGADRADESCEGPAAIRDAASKESARRALDETTRSARLAGQARQQGRNAHTRLRALRNQVVEALRRLPADAAKKAGERINELELRLAALSGEVPAIKADFNAARGQMAAAHKRATNLANFASERAAIVREALAPHSTGPLVAEIQMALDEVDKALGGMECHAGVAHSWDRSDIISDPNWKSRKLRFPWTVDTASSSVAEAKERCKPDEAGSPAGLAREFEAIYRSVESEFVLLDIVKRSYERCVARAILAFDETWLNREEPDLASVPDVLGLPQPSAEQALNAQGLTLAIGGIRPAPAPDLEHVAYAQDPQAGGEGVAAGSAVQVWFYGRHERVAVPGVRGMPVEDAAAIISGAGFKPAPKLLGPAPKDEEPDIVVRQAPGPGSDDVEPGATVTLGYYEKPPETAFPGDGTGEGEADDPWRGPWAASLKLVHISASDGEVGIDCDAAMTCRKQLMKAIEVLLPKAALEDPAQAPLAALPATIWAVFSAGIEVALDGVDAGLALERDELIDGYRVSVIGAPPDQNGMLASFLPALQPTDASELMAAGSIPGEAQADVLIVLRRSAGASQIDLQLTLSGRQDGNSIALTLEGRLTKGRDPVSYEQVVPRLMARMQEKVAPYNALIEKLVK